MRSATASRAVRKMMERALRSRRTRAKAKPLPPGRPTSRIARSGANPRMLSASTASAVAARDKPLLAQAGHHRVAHGALVLDHDHACVRTTHVWALSTFVAEDRLKKRPASARFQPRRGCSADRAASAGVKSPAAPAESDGPFLAAVRQMVQAGTINDAQARILDADIRIGRIDPHQLVADGTMSSAQAHAAMDRLGAIKRSMALAAQQ
jgi:hypothetical protein